MFSLLYFRYNLDPFNRHSDDALWEALEKCHVKNTVCTINPIAFRKAKNDYHFGFSECKRVIGIIQT